MKKISALIISILLLNTFLAFPAFAEEITPPLDENITPPAETITPPVQSTTPEITSFSPTTLIPETTILTITGNNFGDQYIAGKNQICFGNNANYVCINDEYPNNYLQSWSKTEVKILVPPFVRNPGKIGLVVQIPGQEYEAYGVIFSNEEYAVQLPKDPQISSISPSVLIPDETIVTIQGEGFGETFNPEIHQICFSNHCIINTQINEYLLIWSDTQIVIKTPPFVIEPSGAIGLRLYIPSKTAHDFIESPAYTTIQKPLIQMYYSPMEQGRTYTFLGKNFGAAAGKVIINDIECEIISWNDIEVAFRVSPAAQSGKIYFQSADGIKSQELQIEIIQVTIYSNDEFSKLQWYLGTLNIAASWGITEGSENVVVAVIDSGVDINHAELAHAIWTNKDEIPNNGIDDDKNGYVDDAHGWDFILNSNSTATRGIHGTMVASIIAAKKDNIIGIAGVAPNVKIMPLNIVFADEESISVDAALKAIKYAVDNGADIINLSFGGYNSSDYYKEVLQYAYDNNVLVVAAAGNENKNTDIEPYAPASVDLNNNAVIGTAASNKNNLKSSFSNYGTNFVDLTAPGEDIVAAIPSTLEYYSVGKGTSFAAPLAAGIAALIKSKNPTWNIEEIKQVLLSSAISIDNLNPEYANKLGKGIPDAYMALTSQKPDVAYNYNPNTQIEIEETGAEIIIETPEVIPVEEITPEPEPIKITEPPATEPTKNVVEKIELPKNPFSDTNGYKYEEAISWLKDNHIVSGYSDGNFKPNNQINRAEFTKIIINTFQYELSPLTNCFRDVKDEWFSSFICTAKKFRIINGHPDGTFRPNDPINTAEAIKIILEAAGFGLNLQAKPSDQWFDPYIRYIINTNLYFILQENSIEQNITRGQMAEMVYLLHLTEQPIEGY